MSLAILFPGQGSQTPAMLPWLDDDPHARPVLDAMEARVGADWRARSADPEWLSQNRIAQCLVTGIDLAAWRALVGAGLPPATAIAGYSVGEVAAFCAAGVFDVDTALQLALRRAEAMDRSAAGVPGTLLSATGRSRAELAPLLARWGFEVAIDIGPDRCVLGGPRAALDGLDDALKAAGASTVRLAIRVASHTSRMAQASGEFAAAIEPLAWTVPQAALIANDSGARVHRVADLKRCLAGQISHPVRWQSCLNALAERLPACVIEVGPGAALSRLWTAAHPDTAARSADEFDSAASVVAWVRALLR